MTGAEAPALCNGRGFGRKTHVQGNKETAMAKHAQEETGTNRRGFLKLASLGSVATGASLVIGDDAQAAPAATNTDGYRESEHVKTYYESARF